jgi:hypothetical protein
MHSVAGLVEPFIEALGPVTGGDAGHGIEVGIVDWGLDLQLRCRGVPA